MEHQEVELREGATFGAAGNAAARFLRELRQLRDLSGLGLAELAARAHYPRQVIEAAEAGPGLPDLPVLSAYVRGCGGTGEEVADWEDRWRSVTGKKASPLLPARDAGNSDAATAGARIGATSAAADSHNPAAIMAALDRFAERMAEPPPPSSSSPVSESVFGTPIQAGSASGSAIPGMRTPSATDAPTPGAPAVSGHAGSLGHSGPDYSGIQGYSGNQGQSGSQGYSGSRSYSGSFGDALTHGTTDGAAKPGAVKPGSAGGVSPGPGAYATPSETLSSSQAPTVPVRPTESERPAALGGPAEPRRPADPRRSAEPQGVRLRTGGSAHGARRQSMLPGGAGTAIVIGVVLCLLIVLLAIFA